MLSTRLPDYLTARLSHLGIPPQALNSIPNSGNANVILDPTLLSKLPPAIIAAIRAALSDALHDIYIFAALILVLGLVATVFMREVPLAAG